MYPLVCVRITCIIEVINKSIWKEYNDRKYKVAVAINCWAYIDLRGNIKQYLA
jgi:ribosomal protein L28